MRLLVQTFRPFALVALFLAQTFCVLAGCFMALLGSVVHSGLGLAESLVFFIPAVLLTAARRALGRR